jgi:hypothetical protein
MKQTSATKHLVRILLAFGLLINSPQLLAQDDVYDPFIDYSEFEEAGDEEADINFFRHGRFVTLGGLLGQRRLTENMRDVYADSSVFGLSLSYFFDFRFALQFSYITGSHPIRFKGPTTTVRGDSKVNSFGADIKYYLNTQNITRGLATFNPYLVGGFASVSRQNTTDGQAIFSNQSAMAFNAGAGIEFPLMRNKMYIGGQFLYQLVNFKDENSQIILDDGNEPTGIYPSGDFMYIFATLGVNF